MSGTTEEEVHVDTPAQAYARQMIETDQRVTHVRGLDPEPEPPQTEDPASYSLTMLVHKQPQQKAKAATHVEKKEDKK